jgi:NAD(P)-dependent dehydrogenase (short-subunit alcohol dehydrogenase family)
MTFNLHTPISITTRSADQHNLVGLDDKQPDWEYIARLYEDYKHEKNKEFWAYRSVDLAAICRFAPYALIHKVIQKSQGLYGRGKMTGLDIQHLLRNWSYKSVPETFIDVSQTISKTHNWSPTWISRRHEEWIAMLGQDLSGKVKFHKETPSEVCNRLKNYILADSSIILLADKRVSIQQVDKLIYYLPPDNMINSIYSNSRNLMGNTGRVEFRGPSRMRQQVVQMRNNHVFMHPVLYETWYSSAITSLGYPSTDSNPDEGASKPISKVDSIGEWINQTPGLRHKTQADNCHHCAQPKNNQFDYYDRLCWDCGLRAWQIRHKHADLSPIRMCITGCRHTVGWMTSLRALRQGAFVLGTTRFPNLALAAYKLEPDYPEWRDRLVVLGADFTRYPDIQTVISALAEYRINCYVNNAFQTMPNTPDYMASARKLELAPPSDLESLRQVLDVNGNIRPLALTSSAASTDSEETEPSSARLEPRPLSQELAVIQHRFGTGNSWKQPIHKIAPEEIITAGMVNQIAPSLIISAIRQMSFSADSTTTADSHGWPFQVIINVGSSEGDAGVQASITGGHKNHMRKMIECLRAEKDPRLLAYTSDPGFITGVFGKSKPANPSTGLIKVLTADDGGARVLWPLIDFVNSGTRPDEYYRG